jgi:hypothetical protein
VRQAQALVVGQEMHGVIARHAAAAQRGKADRARLALAGDAIAPAHGHVLEAHLPPARRCLAQQQRGARWRVHFHAVVRLDNLDVPVLAQPRRRFLHQVGQQRDAQRGIPGLEHGNRNRRRVDQPVVALFQPGGAHHDRLARMDRRVEIEFQRRRGREIHQHVARLREGRRIAIPVDPAGQVMPGGDHGSLQGLPHAPRAADDADPCHVAIPAMFPRLHKTAPLRVEPESGPECRWPRNVAGFAQSPAMNPVKYSPR